MRNGPARGAGGRGAEGAGSKVSRSASLESAVSSRHTGHSPAGEAPRLSSAPHFGQAEAVTMAPPGPRPGGGPAYHSAVACAEFRVRTGSALLRSPFV